MRGSRLEEGSAVGDDAVAHFNTHLEKGAILAHGAVSVHDMVIPADALAEGNPAGPPVHTITVPLRNPLWTGTLHGILSEVARVRSIAIESLTESL